MAGIRNRIEHWFGALGAFIYDYKYLVLVLVLITAGLMISQIKHITVDTSTEGFLHEDDPKLAGYEAFRDQFGRDEVVIIALKPKDVFDPAFLSELKALHDDLAANVPYLDDINSLINARNTTGKNDELIVEDLLETWPQTPEEFATVKEAALSNAMYKNMLISEDGTFTTIIIQTQAYSAEGETQMGLDDFGDPMPSVDTHSEESPKKYLTDAENSEVVRAVESIVKNHPIPGTSIYVAGSPVVSDFLKRSMMKDMRKFVLIALATIIILLFILFRRISGVLLPLMIVIVSLLSTVGLMALSGTAIKLPTQIMPSFILAVGVGDSVHILVIFFYHFNVHRDKRKAISHALGHSGLAVLMTSLTTAGGLLSFSQAAVAPIADLGLFSAMGVMLAFIYTVILLPALLSIFPIKPKGHMTKTTVKENSGDRFFRSIASVSIHHPKTILLISFMLIAIAITGITRCEFSHNPLKWLPEDSATRIANETIDHELKGSTSLEVVVDTGKKNGLYEPDILNRLEKSANILEDYKTDKVFVGKAWSLTTILKETNKALHNNDPEYYTIPQDKNLIAQEFLLFENSGSDDTEDVTDSQFSKARFTIKVPFIDAISYTGFIHTVRDHFKTTYPDCSIQLTGMITLFVQVITSAIISMRDSYIIALAIITALMMLLIGRVKIGLLSMIPNITPIILIIGIMGWFNISLNLFTMLVGSIAIGLAVDDTIHFMHNFRRYLDETGSAEQAVIMTLQTTGRAMFVTTLVLSMGFFTFMFASMSNLFEFGFLTGATIIMALLSDYFLAPALMILVHKNR